MTKSDLIECQNITFEKRESFNNAIVLLSMVKGELYYICGFSRQNGTILVAFDYESSVHKTITEYFSISFYDDKTIEFKSDLSNVDIKNYGAKTINHFSVEDDSLIYKRTINKELPFPIGFNELHSEILKTKNQIVDYLEEYYKNILIKKEN